MFHILKLRPTHVLNKGCLTLISPCAIGARNWWQSRLEWEGLEQSQQVLVRLRQNEPWKNYHCTGPGGLCGWGLSNTEIPEYQYLVCLFETISQRKILKNLNLHLGMTYHRSASKLIFFESLLRMSNSNVFIHHQKQIYKLAAVLFEFNMSKAEVPDISMATPPLQVGCLQNSRLAQPLRCAVFPGWNLSNSADSARSCQLPKGMWVQLVSLN